MENISELVKKIGQHSHRMYEILANGDLSAEEYSKKITDFSNILTDLEDSLPQSIFADYKEFVDSFITFCKNGDNIDFLKENADTMASSLLIMEEVLEELSDKCSKRIKRCVCCGAQVTYEPYKSETFDRLWEGDKTKYETLNEEEYFCSFCGCSDRDRFITSFLKKINLKYAPDTTKVLQVAPAKSIHEWICNNANQVKYDTADLYMEGVTFKSDIQNLEEIEDSSYDLIICSHVLEHVRDDSMAMAALRRVLKKDGFIVFLVPLDLNVKEIDEEWGLSVEENWKRFGQGDHCRLYSKEGLLSRLKEFFYVNELRKEYFGEEVFRECGLSDTSTLYILTKNKNVDYNLKKEANIDYELCENGPLVSVIMSAYNHGPYVTDAIESVINQSYKNIEFIVADDGSSDNTVAEMKKYSKYFSSETYYESNAGGRFIELKEKATGKYVALMNSDDIWDKDKIAIQVKYLEEHDECGVCLSWCMLVDDEMNEIENRMFYQPNMTRSEWMRRFYDKGNCLCNPSAVSRREFFCDIEPIGAAGRQIPDLFKWVDIFQRTDIYIYPKTLVYMRVLKKNNRENTSAPTAANAARTVVEMANGWFWAIRNMDNAFFKDVFGERFVYKDADSDEEIKMEKFLLLRSNENMFIQNGAIYYFNEIYKDVYRLLGSIYNYSTKDYWDDETRIGMGSIIKQ